MPVYRGEHNAKLAAMEMEHPPSALTIADTSIKPVSTRSTIYPHAQEKNQPAQRSSLLWLLLLEWLKDNEHAYPITLSALLLLYVVVEAVGGSGALGVLFFAVVVGNAAHIGRRANITRELRLHDDVRGFLQKWKPAA